jgi:15-hydroxyprostaglandin dehydrogenase (NAD)
MEIEGKAAVVTGGGSGIGRAMCLALAGRGADVVAVDRNLPGAQETAAAVRELGRKAVAVECDVTDPAQVANALATAQREFGRLDIVCNNAGISVRTPLFEDTAREWVKTIDINLTAVIEGTQQAVIAMQQGRGGVIINTASMGGLLPMPGSPVYAASKAGVVNFSRSLAYLAEESNIRVNAIAPSFVDTPLVREGGEERMQEMAEMVGGILQPEDIAQGVVEIVEDDSRAGAIMRVTIRGGRDYAREIRP